jgi:hypothetical protein
MASAADGADFDPRVVDEWERHKQILERFRVASDAENPRRVEMLTDQKFRCGEQWDRAIKELRDKQGRPCLTINRIPGFLKHVLNTLRQARPEIKVNPVGAGADEEMAEIKQGLIRHIMINSRADVALDVAFENMATMGLGFYRVVDEWCDFRSFDKDLRIEWIPNSFSVYFDPGATKADWSDAKYAFIVEDISVAEFRERFGDKSSYVGLDNFQSIGDHQAVWRPGNKVRIAEYFHIEETEDTLYGFSDGSTLLLGDLNLGAGVDLVSTSAQVIEDPETGEFIEAGVAELSDGRLMMLSDLGLADGVSLTESRKTMVPRVVWELMCGTGRLKKRIWPGRYIPIIPVIGNQIDIDGERILVGMVRFAREAQRMFNYMYSCFVEAVALVPKAPWIAEFDQIQDFRNIWEEAHKTLVTVLPYRAKSTDAGLVPPPQRQQAEPPIAAFVQGLKLSDDNLKATFSIYEASLGERGPQESGKAINARKIESDLATYDWIDNFNRSLIYLGVVLEDLLPHYYNKPGRVVQIMGEDRKIQEIVLNLEHDVKGERKKFDLSKGRYGVVLSTGPSFLTRRQESAAAMMELGKVFPAIWGIAGPQMVRAMDWPDKEAIAAQMEKAMPPELRTQDEESTQEQAQQLQQQLGQAVALIEQLTAKLQEANSVAETERMKELFATFRTQLQEENKLAIANLNSGSREAEFLTKELFNEIRAMRASVEQQLLAGQQEDSPARGSVQTAARDDAAAPPQIPGSALPQETPGGVGTAAT